MPSPSLLTAKHKNRDRPKKKRLSATVVPVSSPYSCDVMLVFMCDFCSYPSSSVLLVFHKQAAAAAAPPTYPLHSQLLLFTVTASASSLRLSEATDFTQSSRINSHK